MDNMEMSEMERKIFTDGQNLAKSLCDAVNPVGYEKEFTKGFIDGFNRQHRTLQQKSGVVLFELLKSLAENYKTKRYDARNEALCEFAYKVVKDNQDTYFPFI